MTEIMNSKEYWERRFSSNDWIEKGGRIQTASFAMAQVAHFNLPSGFNGEILDFGCGLGDAIPVYKARYPDAKLVGMDISQSAVDQCNEKYGHVARFFRGDYTDVPVTDVIIASNVLEHLSNDKEIVRFFLTRCKWLFVTVPYREQPICSEHINAYDENSFQQAEFREYVIFTSRGWTQYGIRGLYYNVYFKNIFRKLLGHQTVRRNMQIMFRFRQG